MLIKNGFNSIDKLYEIVESKDYNKLCEIPLIAEKTAHNIIETLDEPLMRERIAALKEIGLNMEEKEESGSFEQTFENQVWAVTGSFENYNPRTLALEEIEKRGGRTVSAISSKTTHLLLGKGGGSKRDKAQKLNIEIVSEEEFLNLLNIGKTPEKVKKTEYEQQELF